MPKSIVCFNKGQTAMYKMFVQCKLFLKIDLRVGMHVGNSKM